jgi:Ankyrin repeats (3 copies)/Ankyrin repeats (many copies)
MDIGTSRCRQTLGALALSLALFAPFTAIAERNVDTALRKASQAGDLAEIQHQLELGAEPNQAYALVAAVQGNQLAAVKYLLAHGADPNAWTRINLRVPEGAAYSPIFVAASQGNREILSYLKSHGADVNAEWTRERSPSQTALGASILAGDLQSTQLLIEYGANVNLVPRRGDLPLIQTVFARKNNVELAQLLLRQGADPDIKNADGVSPRRQSRGYGTLRTSIDQAKPVSATQLEPEDMLDVAMALHGYQTQMAADYSRWRISQAEALSRLEASPDFQTPQAGAKAAFDEARAQLSGDELREQMQTLHRICEVALVDQFRTGTPVSEAGTGATPPADTIKPAAPMVKTSVTVHRTAAPPAAGGGMASHP